MYTSKIKNIKTKEEVPGSMIYGQILMNSTGKEIPLAGDASTIIEGEWTDELDWLFEESPKKASGAKALSGEIPEVLQYGRVGVYKVTDQRITNMVQFIGSELASASSIGNKLPKFKEPMVNYINRMAELLEIPEELMPIVNDASSCFSDNASIVWAETSFDPDIQNFLETNGFYILNVTYLMAAGGLNTFTIGRKYTSQEDMALFLQTYGICSGENLIAYMFYDNNTYDIYMLVYCNAEMPNLPDLPVN